MRDQDLLDWTTANSKAIAAAAESGSDTAIPSCPGWTMSDLLSHTSNTINGWFADNIARARDDVGAGSGLHSFSAMVSGCLSATALAQMGRVEVVDPSALTDWDRAVATRHRPHCMDNF